MRESNIASDDGEVVDGTGHLMKKSAFEQLNSLKGKDLKCGNKQQSQLPPHPAAPSRT
jgi:hypothetical protein